ncbi:MAG: T9SS C-terminal target domain-containing protein [Chitinophagia bacterium]|nr:T9SS C-terminal target domain-containing protein [Chitinophagia bacterium]
MSYAFHTPNQSNYSVTVNYATTSAATFAVELDGNLLSTYTPGSTAGSVVASSPASAGCAAGRMHSVRIVVLSGTVTVHSVAVAPASMAALRASAIATATPVADGGIEAFPNPARYTLNLRLPAGSRRLEIQDVMGRTLRAQTAVPGSFRLDISSLPAGMYLITVSSSDGHRSVLRFVKE